ncbi:MAG: hypothetical protein ACHQT8_04355, partial [Chlamydiales bacterium]
MKIIKKKIFNVSVVGLVALMALLTSWEGFRHSPMVSLGSSMVAFASEVKGLRVTAKRYTSGDSKKYLHR